MDPTSAATSILRIQQLPAYQTGGQQQQSPFAQGQMLHGVISARGGNNQFTINIGGQQVQAESTAQLQVGQKLDLEVAALSPRVELRIVTNPVNRFIGNSIHLIGQQTSILSGLAQLGEHSNLLPQLSADAQGTLQLYAKALGAEQAASTPFSTQTRDLFGQLAGTALDAMLSRKDLTAPAFREAVAGMLRQLGLTPSLPTRIADQATQLATEFGSATATQTVGADQLQTSSAPTSFLSSQELGQLFNLASKQGFPLPQNTLAELFPGLQGGQGLAIPPALRNLVSFLTDLDIGQNALPRLDINGSQVRQLIDRLGINMERLLAEGRQQEAVQTLKYALLELIQQLPAEDKSVLQADQMTKSIELFQLLQIRLAGESLLFLPLPFSFLDQGYLVIDQDQQSGGKEEAGGQRVPAYELHLRLAGLGNLQINIRQEEGRLFVTFYAQDAERARFLAGFRQELDRWLTSADLESVRFLVGAKDPARTLLEKIVHGVTGMVDTSA